MITLPVEIEKTTLDFFRKVIIYQQKINIGVPELKRVSDSYNFLREFSGNKIIYGINTGFGPMAQYRIDESDLKQLQYNLIRSHAGGAGNPLKEDHVKAAMLCRLIGLLQGYSGVHESVVLLLREFINRDITPVVFEHGGVGASGDLVQLSHIALALIGEGEVFYKGEIRSTGEVLAENNLKPAEIMIREGLSLINGTSVMTGIGIVNLIEARNIFEWAVFFSALINELVDSYDDSFSAYVNDLKNHTGQSHVAALMRNYLEGSPMIRKRHQHLYNNHRIHGPLLKEKVQEYYSLRCVPQILGPVYDSLNFIEKILLEEACSVNDNPVVDPIRKDVHHGGNFHGDYVSLEMDKLKVVITKLSMLVERQLNFILNDKLNQKYPPFVNLGKPGLNLGMQGIQFTATSTVAENQTLSYPNYLHSIPNNNDNQDIVSMGANSALIAARVIRNTAEVMAIHAMALIQATEFLKNKQNLSPKTEAVVLQLRELVPVFVEDTTKYKEIALLKNHILFNKPDPEK